MTTKSFSKTEMYNDITQIIQGSPAMPISALPQIWQQLAKSPAGTGLNDAQRRDYVEAAQLFRYHETPLCLEALSTIGKDFLLGAYPDFDALLAQANNKLGTNMITAVKALFGEFGYAVPASFYNIILETVREENPQISIKMFKNKKALMQDRLWDAVLHASLLVTPIGLYVQSVLSQHGVRFTHMMNCSCSPSANPDAAFVIALDQDLKSAYLQNMVAASFEQYGVNAATSRQGRGF
jgi:hypothetical protein